MERDKRDKRDKEKSKLYILRSKTDPKDVYTWYMKESQVVDAIRNGYIVELVPDE